MSIEQSNFSPAPNSTIIINDVMQNVPSTIATRKKLNCNYAILNQKDTETMGRAAWRIEVNVVQTRLSEYFWAKMLMP